MDNRCMTKMKTATLLLGISFVIVFFIAYSGLIPPLNSHSENMGGPTLTSSPVEENSANTPEAVLSSTASTVRSPTQVQTPTPSPIRTPTSSPTPTSTPLSTVSPTLTPTQTSKFSNEKYDEFVSAVFGEAEVDTEIPIRVRAWTVAEGNSLIVILNLTADSENNAKRVKEVNTFVTSGYAQAVAHHDTGKIGGKITDRLRIAEVNNTGATPKTLIVNTSLAREYYTGQINAVEFTEEYWSTERNMTSDEIEFVYNMDLRTGNQTLYNETAD
ncbi:hypothetical protein HZS55_19195 [Halosimplex rubrum]|uniref:Uncharacterized protein n=1 Tax=Halosimplex rubrum TaxID=869889 RepID=A0A7D5T1V6_9EURY|nr:hypothetical protein [Halosimplex rubrum]QLH79288.1 hypothetical protein HZS55_19195 [Halosimplex rubrum]